jgi:hypothetical protein
MENQNQIKGLEVFDIQMARENSRKFGDDEKIKEFAAKLVKIINEQISKASNQGENSCDFSINCAKFFGRSYIKDKVAEKLVAHVSDVYTNAGYDIDISNGYTKTYFEPWACIFTDFCEPSKFTIHISWDKKD